MVTNTLVEKLTCYVPLGEIAFRPFGFAFDECVLALKDAGIDPDKSFAFLCGILGCHL
jgi:hypothetical protein